jgi:protein involved in polysaccharide export with SLBB domain
MISMIKKLSRYALAALFAASIVLVGCDTIGQPAGSAKSGASAAPSADRIPLRVGDSVKVILTFPNRPNSTQFPTEEHKVTVKEDGTIALPYFPAIPAANKTCKEVEQAVHDLYVPAYYTTLGVTVEPDSRFFYVGGEVLKNDRHEYIGPITVTQAIQSSQGFTEYANRKKIRLIRSTGKIEIVNWNQAIDHPDKDPQVYPGDKVEVPRRWF